MIEDNRLNEEDNITTRFDWQYMIWDIYAKLLNKFFVEANPVVKGLIVPFL